jgi:methyl-accepting chemotaxis protein
MSELAADVVTATNDLIDDCLGLTRSLAMQQASLAALQGDTSGLPFLQDQIGALLKTRPVLNSTFLFDRTGKAVAGLTAQGGTMAGVDLSGRSYVREILDGKDHVSREVVLGKATGIPSFMVVTPVRDAAGAIVGGAGIAVNWAVFTQKNVQPLKVGTSGYVYILDATGKILAHPDKDMALSDSSRDLGFVKETLARKKGIVEYTYKGQDKVQAFDTVARTGWTVCANTLAADLNAFAVHQRNTIIVAGAVAYLALLSVLLLVMRRQVTAPLRAIMAYSSRVAAGDLTAALNNRFRFELRDLGDNIVHMTGELRSKIGFTEGVLKAIATPFVIVDTAEVLRVTNAGLLRLLEHHGKPEDFYGQNVSHFFYGDATRKTVLSTAMAEKRVITKEVELISRKGSKRSVRIDATPLLDSITGQLTGALCVYADLSEVRMNEARVLEQGQKIAVAARQADAIAEQVSSASQELSAQVEESSRGSERQRDRSAEAATAMGQMNATVLEVARNASDVAHGAEEAKRKAQDGARVVDDAIRSIFEVSDQTRSMRDSLGELGRQAEAIGQVMGVIGDIADQTNLLALNAAIEAARAGDAGRGFAVVADEVRKLAEKTMTATKEVGRVVTDIQQGTAVSVKAMDGAVGAVEKTTGLAEKAGVSLREIVSLVETTAERVTTIAAASEEQSAATEQVSRSIEEISRISSETADSMGQSAQAVNDLARLAATLKDVIRAMRS